MILRRRVRTGSDSIFVEQDWTRTEKFHSALVSLVSRKVYVRDEHWTGSGLWWIVFIFDWIRIENASQILDQDQIWTELMDKNCVIFIIKKFYFAEFLDFISTWTLHFLNFLDYGWN